MGWQDSKLADSASSWRDSPLASQTTELDKEPKGGYMVPFRDGMRPASKQEYEAYQKTHGRENLPAAGGVLGGLLGPTGGAAGASIGLSVRDLMDTADASRLPESADSQVDEQIKSAVPYALFGAGAKAIPAAASAIGSVAGKLPLKGLIAGMAARAAGVPATMVRGAQALYRAGQTAEGAVGEVLPFAPKAAPVVAPVAAEAAPLTATIAEKVAPEAAKAIPEAVSNHAALVRFAKEVASKNPKVGAKIWMELDEAGQPVKYLTPDQAGAAARAGKPTTWIKNLWGDARDLD